MKNQTTLALVRKGNRVKKMRFVEDGDFLRDKKGTVQILKTTRPYIYEPEWWELFTRRQNAYDVSWEGAVTFDPPKKGALLDDDDALVRVSPEMLAAWLDARDTGAMLERVKPFDWRTALPLLGAGAFVGAIITVGLLRVAGAFA